jgi:hypothetical protein
MLLSTLIVAAAIAQPAFPRVERVAYATVTIIAAEEISLLRHTAQDKDKARPRTARQHRIRNNMPLVEFY